MCSRPCRSEWIPGPNRKSPRGEPESSRLVEATQRVITRPRPNSDIGRQPLETTQASFLSAIVLRMRWREFLGAVVSAGSSPLAAHAQQCHD